MGNVYYARAEYDAALALFKSAPVLEKVGDRATLATVYNNIGQVHRARAPRWRCSKKPPRC